MAAPQRIYIPEGTTTVITDWTTLSPATRVDVYELKFVGTVNSVSAVQLLDDKGNAVLTVNKP